MQFILEMYLSAAQFGRLVTFIYFHWSILDCREGNFSLVFILKALNPFPHEYIQEMEDILVFFLPSSRSIFNSV